MLTRAAAPPGTPAALEATAISVSFAGMRALSDVDLMVRPGEILGLIGPNGAGKTTLTNALTGYQHHDGRLRLAGRDVTSYGPRHLARAGVRRTFQAVRLFGDLSVRENLEVTGIGLGLSSRAARHAATDTLDWTDLMEHAEKRAGDLAYGVQRRLGVARAVVGPVTVLLLDEPAAGLNEQEGAELTELLATVPERLGCGLVVIEHDLPLIMRLCHRVQVLVHGETLAVGAPAAIRHDPAVIEAYLGAHAGDGAPR